MIVVNLSNWLSDIFLYLIKLEYCIFTHVLLSNLPLSLDGRLTLEESLRCLELALS